MALQMIDQFLLWAQSPVGIITICGVLIFVAYFVITRFVGKKEDEFITEMFEDVVNKDLEEKFKVHGVKSNGALVQGFDFLGTVDRWVRVKGSFKNLIYDRKKEDFIVPNVKKTAAAGIKEVVDYDLYLFRIWKTNALFKFFGFGDRKFVIVESKHISNLDTIKGAEQWNLKKDIAFTRWANIFITSQAAEEYISDIAIKRSHENTLTYLMNYARKIIYLEFQHAKNSDKYATRKKIDKKAWSEYKRASDIEESEDDDD